MGGVIAFLCLPDTILMAVGLREFYLVGCRILLCLGALFWDVIKGLERGLLGLL